MLSENYFGSGFLLICAYLIGSLPNAFLVVYFTNISFWIFINPSAFAFTKYTPLAAWDASQLSLYVPASLYPLVSVEID